MSPEQQIYTITIAQQALSAEVQLQWLEGRKNSEEVTAHTGEGDFPTTIGSLRRAYRIVQIARVREITDMGFGDQIREDLSRIDIHKPSK